MQFPQLPWRHISRLCLALVLACSGLLSSCVVSASRSDGSVDLPAAEAERSRGLVDSYAFDAADLDRRAWKDGEDTPQRNPQDAIARRMIYAGSLVLGVGDLHRARTELRTLCEELGGYVQSEREASMVLRIPSAQWQVGVDRAASAGQEIARQIDVQDVTEQYVDLELRLKNARALRDRLEQLLQRADDIKAALEVEHELTRIRLEIEQLEATLRSLAQRVSFGTLSVNLKSLAQVPRHSAELPYGWLNGLGVENLLGRGGAR